MRTRFVAVFAICLSLVACDKVAKLIDKSSGKNQADAGKNAEPKEIPIDPELAKLIDRNEEGVLFRRDLPFPKEIRVSITEKEPMAVRLFQQSEVSKQVTTLDVVRHFSMQIRKGPGSVQFAGYKEEFYDNKPVVKDLPKGKAKGSSKDASKDLAPAPVKGHPLLAPVPPKDHTMIFRQDKWRADSNTGFAEASLAQQLGPQMNPLLHEYGLNPRPLWFGKRRIVAGKPMAITGELLPMLVVGKATGELTITLEDVESVHGHPCGRFAIKGSYQRKEFPFLDGRLFNEETTIQSGHVWMSVLHPLVLKYHVNRIVTLSVAEGSGPAMRFQGSTSPMRSIDWKALE